MRRPLLLSCLCCAAVVGCSDRSRSPVDDGTPPGPATPGEAAGPAGRIPDVTRDEVLALRTDTLRYALRRQGDVLLVDIPYRYLNRTGAPAYLPGCLTDAEPLPPALEKENRPGKWVRAWSPDPRGCLPDRRPLVLPARALRDDTLHVVAPLAADSQSAFTVSPPEGVYRLVWRLLGAFDGAAPGYGPVLPDSQRLSNRFVLDPPR